MSEAGLLRILSLLLYLWNGTLDCWTQLSLLRSLVLLESLRSSFSLDSASIRSVSALRQHEARGHVAKPHNRCLFGARLPQGFGYTNAPPPGTTSSMDILGVLVSISSGWAWSQSWRLTSTYTYW